MEAARESRHADVPLVACRVAETRDMLGVYATSPIAAGAVLLVERPFVLTPAWNDRRRVCAHCFAASERDWPVHCERCKCVAYCSDECAAAASAAGLHSETECAALAEYLKDSGSFRVAQVRQSIW